LEPIIPIQTTVIRFHKPQPGIDLTRTLDVLVRQHAFIDSFKHSLNLLSLLTYVLKW